MGNIGGPWIAYFGERGALSATPYAAGLTESDVTTAVDMVRAEYPDADYAVRPDGTRVITRGRNAWVWRNEG